MNITWKNFEGITEGYGELDGLSFEIIIGPRVHASNKWNVKADNDRAWTLVVSRGMERVAVVNGKSEGLPAAKKAALAALKLQTTELVNS